MQSEPTEDLMQAGYAGLLNGTLTGAARGEVGGRV